MDTEKILEKLMKWLADPKGREMFKTIVYLIIPLFLIIGLRNVARRRPAEKSSTAIEPKIRPSTYESWGATESVRETRAREQRKVDRELQEFLGRRDTVLGKAKEELNKSTTTKKTRPSESPAPEEKNLLQEELLKLFSRRPN